MKKERRPPRLFGRKAILLPEAEDLEVTAADNDEGADEDDTATLQGDEDDPVDADEAPTPRARPAPPVITEVKRVRAPIEDEDAEAEIFLAMEFARRRSARPGLPTDPGNQYMDTMSLGETFGTHMSGVPEEEGDLGSYERQHNIEVPELDPEIAREIAESREAAFGDGSPPWITGDPESDGDDIDEVTPLGWVNDATEARSTKRPDDEDDDVVVVDDATPGASGNRASGGPASEKQTFEV